LHAPDYLFLDEATASLDEAAEAALYHLLQERLKGATIISIGHRSSLGAFHGRRIELVPEAAVHRVREVPLPSAAEGPRAGRGLACQLPRPHGRKQPGFY